MAAEPTEEPPAPDPGDPRRKARPVPGEASCAGDPQRGAAPEEAADSPHEENPLERALGRTPPPPD